MGRKKENAVWFGADSCLSTPLALHVLIAHTQRVTQNTG
jgi:hypothetical protein